MMTATTVTWDDIQHVVDEIVALFRPRRAILFGSFAYGQPHADSDVDLLVEMDTPLRGPEQATIIHDLVRFPFPVDVLVRPPDQIQERLKRGDSFVHEIVNKGRTLHEATH